MSGKINKAFLAAIDSKTKADVLGNIAKHYGISPEEAYDEVVDDDAEHLLDYVAGPMRAAVSVLFQKKFGSK